MGLFANDDGFWEKLTIAHGCGIEGVAREGECGASCGAEDGESGGDVPDGCVG